jgi:hypothetical protein
VNTDRFSGKDRTTFLSVVAHGNNVIELLPGISSADFERCPEISIPIWAIDRIASGRTDDGATPALSTSNRSPAIIRKSPSAIWLRAEFPVHRIRTRFLSLIVFIFL